MTQDIDTQKEVLLPSLSRVVLQLDGETAQALNKAELAIRSLNRVYDDELEAQIFSGICLNIETIAADRMSGRQINARHFFWHTIMKPQKDEKGLKAKSEILHNREALKYACTLGTEPVSDETFLSIHRCLLEDTTRESFKGVLRNSTLLVGGDRYYAFGQTPQVPSPESISALLQDLAVFCNSATIPAVAQAALAHVQFLAIHPFPRANGKTARALFQLVFQQRGLIDKTIAPLSLALAITSHDYQRGVHLAMENLLREDINHEELNAWLAYFAQCCVRSVTEIESFEQRAMTLQESWLERLGVRSDSAITLLIKALPGIPVFTATSATEYLDRSFKRITAAIDELLAAGIIVQITEGKRNRAFECPTLIDSYAQIAGFQ